MSSRDDEDDRADAIARLAPQPSPSPITRRLTCELFEIGKPNHNRRIYLETHARHMVEKTNEKAKLRRAMGCLGYPEDGKTRMADVSHLCEPDFAIENGRVVGSVTTLPTPRGLVLRQMLDSGVGLTLAPRGLGWADANGVIGGDYEIAAFDVMATEDALRERPMSDRAALERIYELLKGEDAGDICLDIGHLLARVLNHSHPCATH